VGEVGGIAGRVTADFLFSKVTVQVTVAVEGRLAGLQFTPSLDSKR
jgi:hypothetical protein